MVDAGTDTSTLLTSPFTLGAMTTVWLPFFTACSTMLLPTEELMVAEAVSPFVVAPGVTVVEVPLLLTLELPPETLLLPPAALLHRRCCRRRVCRGFRDHREVLDHR